MKNIFIKIKNVLTKTFLGQVFLTMIGITIFMCSVFLLLCLGDIFIDYLNSINPNISPLIQIIGILFGISVFFVFMWRDIDSYKLK